MKREYSGFDYENPKDGRTRENLSNHDREACLRPYIDFCIIYSVLLMLSNLMVDPYIFSQ